MRGFALFICLLLVAGGATGQTLRVQTGDHAGFTRLVIPIGTQRGWDIVEQDSRLLELRLDPSPDGFDVSGAFNLIQRNRLADLTGEETLTLSLACDCEVSGTRYQEQYLVIDIADPDPNAPLPDEGAADTGLSGDRERAVEALPNLASLLAAPSQLPRLPEQPLLDAPAPEQAPLREEDDPEGPNPRIAEAAEIMAEQLARAAASGLLDPALDQPQTFADPISRRDDPSEVANPDADEALPEADGGVDAQDPLLSELPVRAVTGLDPGLQPEINLTPAPQGGCASETLDAREWAEGDGFEQGLGELRLALYDDRDQLVDEAARDLALYYLHYGFGAEARFWLSQLPNPPQDYLQLAALVDGADQVAFDPVTSPADCTQGELLWRYIGGAVTVELTSEDLAAIQRAYAMLPTHLRDLLGPRLARALHADRHGPAARNIRDILHRGGRISQAELNLLDLDLGLALPGSVSETRDVLSNMLTNDGSDPVSTMAQALAFDRQAGIRPPATRLVAAEALLREHGSGPETNALWQEILLGHAATGAIETAMTMLGDPARAGAAREAALTEMVANRVQVEDTATLLILAYSFGAEWRPEGSEAGRAQVAAISMLREAGLYEAAQILRDVRRPLILPPANTDEQPEPDALAEAWEASDWERVSQLASGAHADLAARLVAREAEAATGVAAAGDLASLNETVLDSRALRETVSALLTRPRPE